MNSHRVRITLLVVGIIISSSLSASDPLEDRQFTCKQLLKGTAWAAATLAVLSPVVRSTSREVQYETFCRQVRASQWIEVEGEHSSFLAEHFIESNCRYAGGLYPFTRGWQFFSESTVEDMYYLLCHAAQNGSAGSEFQSALIEFELVKLLRTPPSPEGAEKFRNRFFLLSQNAPTDHDWAWRRYSAAEQIHRLFALWVKASFSDREDSGSTTELAAFFSDNLSRAKKLYPEQ